MRSTARTTWSRARGLRRQPRPAPLAELPKAGIDRDRAPADGAFYLYADVGAFTDDSLTFAREMLEEAHVAATPGVDFGSARGRHFIRFSYAGRTEDMAEAARRLQSWKRLERP